MRAFFLIAILTALSFNVACTSKGQADETCQAGDVWLRVNQAGYTPEREKVAIVLSDTDIAGRSWRLMSGKKVVLSGKLGAARQGDNYHVAQAFNFTIDFSKVKQIGDFTLELAGAETVQVRILNDPYSLFAAQALMHLRAMRSGCDTRFNKAGHLGDSAAVVHVVKGDFREGAWKEAVPRRTLNMSGGHYDAGDYIKFTLTQAYLAWQLLTAYNENPALFDRAKNEFDSDLLDEAKWSLDYLAKTFPDNNTFVIQVADKDDHKWDVRGNIRMPDEDVLDGKRPALCALARSQMGSTAAALALGAHVFEKLDAEASAKYKEKAKAIYARARLDDTQPSAFERDITNDFYHDTSYVDNMALAAAELYRLTKLQNYLDDAVAYSPEVAPKTSWIHWFGFANHLMANLGDEAAKGRILEEVAQYEQDNLWNSSGDFYTWGTLHNWIGMANAHLRAKRDFKGETQLTSPFSGTLDYVFGRNNWGIAMFASPDLPYCIQNVYSQIYTLTKAFPVGAISPGPAGREWHEPMRQWMSYSEDNPFVKFDTEAVVFNDDSGDFVIQETTLTIQGDIILMLALAAKQTK